MLFEVYLLNYLDVIKLSVFNGFDALTELSSSLSDLSEETIIQFFHDVVPKCFFITCSCLWIVVCVLFSAIFIVIQGIF